MRLKIIEMDGWYDVYNKKNEHLGIIEFRDDWKCWVWGQNSSTDMSWDCLQEVVNFMKSKL